MRVDLPWPLAYNGRMRTTLLLAATAAVLALSSVSSFAADTPAKASGEGHGSKHTDHKDHKGSLHHVVCLKFKPSATKEQIKAVEDAFRELKTKVPGITSLEWGTNVSPEKHDKGFTHCFILTFASDKDRDAYLVHEDHKAFGKVLGPVLGDVFVIDFWAKE